MKILVVESAAKAKTIQKYLGKGWRVHATGGHIQGLPESGKEGRKAMWASRAGDLPSPPWEWTDRGQKAVDAILADADEHGVEGFYLATDPDREGEFIAWRLAELLEERAPTHRITFQEVTDDAVLAAIEAPRPIDMDLVNSARVRKFLDRLVGFRTSKFASSFLTGRGAASMGRVQTPALGFVVERELEREAHVPIPYFEVRVSAAELGFTARFHEPSDPDVWRDDNGKAQPNRTADGALATKTAEALDAAASIRIDEAKPGSTTRQPKPPFSTDTLLQAAGSRWGWSPKKTMMLATRLYEAGHITYIRTDSVRIADSARDAVRALVSSTWGEDHLGPGARTRAAAGKIQDAHEAIRPSRLDVDVPPDVDDTDALRLYSLIRARVLGSQMSVSRYERVGLVARVEGLEVPLTHTVSWRVHAGWEAAYAELNPPAVTAPPAVSLDVGAELTIDPATEEAPNPLLIEDATKPPPRLRAHTLIRRMKESGIGRPSTYAKTVEKLEARNYVEIDGGALIPTDRGRTVWLEITPFYEDDSKHTDLFSVEFTAEMEQTLDQIETGDEPAPASWERLRDHVRDLHNVARERCKSGAATPKRLARLRNLLENAPAGAPVPEDLTALTDAQAQEAIQRLLDLGVEPAPSEAQRGYVTLLAERAGLSAEEAAALVGLASLDEIQTSKQASSAIEVLRERAAQSKPASPKQLGVIRKLAGKLELDEAAACALVEVADYEALTGGWHGTASALIDALKERSKAPGAAKGAAKDD